MLSQDHEDLYKPLYIYISIKRLSKKTTSMIDRPSMNQNDSLIVNLFQSLFPKCHSAAHMWTTVISTH